MSALSHFPWPSGVVPCPGLPQAPPLPLLVSMCRDCRDWLGAHPAHVVAVHCKAGKGRTGAAVCALLLALVRHGPGPQAHWLLQGACRNYGGSRPEDSGSVWVRVT